MKKRKRVLGTAWIRTTAKEVVIGFNKIDSDEIDQLLYKQESVVNPNAAGLDIKLWPSKCALRHGLKAEWEIKDTTKCNIRLLILTSIN